MNEPRNVPLVHIHESATGRPSAIALKATLEQAASQLGSLGAWRQDYGAVEIVIYDKGLSTQGKGPPSMRVALPYDDEAPAGLIRRQADSTVVIEASERLFVDEVGARLVKEGASVEEAAFHLLAHEIHHLDEIERQAACGISYERRGSAFAGAVRPDFPPRLEARRASADEPIP